MPAYEAFATLPGFVDGGFARGTEELQIYWYGDLTASARAAIRSVTEQGLNIRVIHTRFDEGELLEAMSALEAELAATGREYSAIRIVDGLGRLEVAVPDSVGGVTRAEMDRLGQLTLNMPVSIVTEPSRPVVLFDTRDNDTAPFDAAGNVGGCTSGLALVRPYGHYLLTAAHCAGFLNGQSFTTPGSTNLGINSYTGMLYGSQAPNYGPNNLAETGIRLDATMINIPDGQQTSASMFYGSRTASTKYTIHGTSTIPFGVSICVSGSGTGSRCNIVRESSWMELVCAAVLFGGCIGWVHVVRVNSGNGQIMFGGGDSGAPVYYVNQGGARVVTSIVQGGDGNLAVSCGTLNPGNVCSIDGGFVTSMNYILQEVAGQGFVVRTGPVGT